MGQYGGLRYGDSACIPSAAREKLSGLGDACLSASSCERAACGRMGGRIAEAVCFFCGGIGMEAFLHDKGRGLAGNGAGAEDCRRTAEFLCGMGKPCGNDGGAAGGFPHFKLAISPWEGNKAACEAFHFGNQAEISGGNDRRNHYACTSGNQTARFCGKAEAEQCRDGYGDAHLYGRSGFSEEIYEGGN